MSANLCLFPCFDVGIRLSRNTIQSNQRSCIGLFVEIETGTAVKRTVAVRRSISVHSYIELDCRNYIFFVSTAFDHATYNLSCTIWFLSVVGMFLIYYWNSFIVIVGFMKKENSKYWTFQLQFKNGSVVLFVVEKSGETDRDKKKPRTCVMCIVFGKKRSVLLVFTPGP